MTVTTPSATAKGPPSAALEALRAIDWLADVTPSALERLAEQAMIVRMPRGAQIFEQSEVPGVAQLLLTGSVELLGVREDNETLIETIDAVDLLLPAAVLAKAPYLVRARVREDATLLLIPAELFRTTVTLDQGLSLAMTACLVAQFRRQMKLAKATRLRSAEERVGSYLLALAEASPHAREIQLPVEKRQIASQLGMTRETLSRALGPLKAHGLSVVGDRLIVENLAAARAAFPYDPLLDAREDIRPLPLGDSQ